MRDIIINYWIVAGVIGVAWVVGWDEVGPEGVGYVY